MKTIKTEYTDKDIKQYVYVIEHSLSQEWKDFAEKILKTFLIFSWLHKDSFHKATESWNDL